jgi:hypothetical protein
MQWKITIEGMDEFGEGHRAELVITKDFGRLCEGKVGLSIDDGKVIMAHLQQFVLKQQCEEYVLTSRFCADCRKFRRIKDHGSARSEPCSAASK